MNPNCHLLDKNANRACQDQPMFEVPKRTHVGQHPCIAQIGPSKQNVWKRKFRRTQDMMCTCPRKQVRQRRRHPLLGILEAMKRRIGQGSRRVLERNATSVSRGIPPQQVFTHGHPPHRELHNQPCRHNRHTPGSTTQEKSDRSASDTPMTATPKSGAAFIAMPIA